MSSLASTTGVNVGSSIAQAAIAMGRTQMSDSVGGAPAGMLGRPRALLATERAKSEVVKIWRDAVKILS